MKTEDQLKQTIEFLHKDIETLNARVNASEDGSGLAALRVEHEELQVKYDTLTAEHTETVDKLGTALAEVWELKQKLPPEPEPVPETEPEPEPETEDAPEG